MNLKSLLTALTIVVPAILYAGAYRMEIASLPQGSGFTIENYDAATDTWTLKVTSQGGAMAPVFTMNVVPEALPAELTAFCFDYRSTDADDNIEMTMYKVFMGNSTQTYTFPQGIASTDEWRTLRVDMSAQRKAAACRFLNTAKGQYQSLKFQGLPVGATIEIRNIRYDENEFPYKDILITATGKSVIEAEDFNLSADNNAGHTTHQVIIPAWKTHYHNPCGDRFPIFAWCSVDLGGRGWGDEGTDFLNYQYRELEECGFTITHGTAYPGVDNAFLFDNQRVNTDNVANLHEGTNLMMMCSSSLDTYDDRNNWVRQRMESDRLAGYFIKDEPRLDDFNGMERKLDHIRSIDPDHLFYCNLHNINTDMSAIGFKNYDEYAHRLISQVGSGFLSYDFYPVRAYDSTNEVYIEPNFFHNLEVVSKIAKYYGTTFWAFAHSVASECFTAGVHYPSPEEDHMRVQVFGNLAYGAQGIEYFTYKCPNPYGGYNYYDAPISTTDERTPTWYMVQNINRDVHALTWVFLGCDMLRVGHTNAETPVGCTRLTDDMLPKGITAVSSDGPGVCVSVLQNGTNLFLMVLNADIHKTQQVTIARSADMQQVQIDGTTTALSAGSTDYDVAPGHFVLYLVSDDEAPVEYCEPTEYVNADYRDDATGMYISSSPTASNGYYLPHMGDTRWGSYSRYIPTMATREITAQQAADNWGSTFSYTVEVAEDMEADIYVGHAVPWREYGRIASTGVAPGFSYIMADDPSLNWPKEYAASMVLEVDGNDLKPSNQPLRPVAPAYYDEAGTEYEAILADKSQWVPTDGNALYFWPKSGSDKGEEMVLNEKPDYAKVVLTAGTHRITVKSLCSPWHFDNLTIVRHDDSSIKDIAIDAEAFGATGIRGAVVVEAAGDYSIVNMGGATVAAGSGNATIGLPTGLYIVTDNHGRAIKVAVR